MNVRLFAIVVGLAASLADAAEITRVASSFEPNDPFGLFADLTYLYTQSVGKITREAYQGGDNIDVTELRYRMVEHKIQADIHLGLYKDLEFHFGLPFIFAQDREWGFAKGTDATNSTITNNRLRADGSLVPGGTTQSLFSFDPEANAHSYRSGLGDLTFGLAWAVLNQKKDDANPTWVLSFDYTAPIAEAIDPTAPTSGSDRGKVGDKIHRYKFSTAISKRIAFADPYFSLHYTLPWQSSGVYSNCDHPDASRMAMPGNCEQPGWSRLQTAIQPPHVGGFIFGAEFNAFESSNKHQKLALDLRGSVTYVSEGRYYNPMSDLFGKLLYTSDYVSMTGHVGIVGHAAEFVHLKLYAEMTYNTEHTLTSENIGKDLVEPLNGTVDVTAHPQEVSPLFDYRIDRVGRRFRMQEETIFRFMAQASFNF
ncbi:MAG: hypothetical protein IPJ65_13420 [Archangiaceae bacterium]|nr:hypothetical protein [Archangiaceae bacterium]